MRGGGVGAGYSVGPDVLVKGMPYLVNDGSVGNCHAVAPSYALHGVSAVGLPGMRGGKRSSGRRLRSMKKRSSGKRSKRSMRLRGGRYAVEPTPVAMDTPNVVSTNTRIACEMGQGSANPSPTHMTGGALVAPYSGGTPLEESTAGYTHLRNGADVLANTQAGVPFMINVPSGGQLGVSNACVKTGGGRSSRAKSKRSVRRSSRKATRKSRKARSHKRSSRAKRSN